jgi:hypothetical protein
VAIGVEEVLLIEGGGEGELLAVGRENGIVIGSGKGRRMDLIIVREINEINVGIDGGGERRTL